MSINVTDGAEYTEVLRQLNTWYGQDAPKIVNVINTYGLTPEQVTQDYLSGSGFEPWYTSGASVGGYNTVGSFSANASSGGAASSLNSNIGATSTVAVKTPVETTYNQAGKLVASNGLTSVATGAKSALTFVSKEVLPAVNAAGLGIALGKTIDSALYNLNPDFWDNNGMATLNPETWNNITKDYPNGVLKKAFNTIFGLNPQTGETQQYLDADAAAYLAQYMQENGVFALSNEHGSIEDTSNLFNPTMAQPVTYIGNTYAETYTSGDHTYLRQWTTTAQAGWIKSGSGGSIGAGSLCFFSTSPFTYTVTDTDQETGTTVTIISGNGSAKASHGITYYVRATTALYNPITAEGYNPNLASYNATNLMWDTAYIYNNGTVDPAGGIDGITNQDGATQPNFSGCTTAADYANALRSQYPDLFDNAVTQTIANPDGTTTTKTFIPIGTPSKNNNGNQTQPVTNNDNSGNTQDDTKANPSTLDLTGLENLINTLTESLNKDGTPTDPQNPDPTGSGTTPPVVAPTGNASALWSVYNPSQAQLNSFGAWLWSSNFIDQILKLFNNPMQSIIGVHKIFATPPTSGSGNIVVGYLDSGVGANLVSAQYTTIDCGSVNVREQFGNVFDYTDTTIRLYLPFIGIVDLDTSDVMRGSVHVVYHVDVITGACLAEVKITRDASGGTLYQYAGDAAVRYPISSGSYMGVVAGIASAVGGVASAVMTGGATLPLAAGAVAGGISGAHTQVQHSGNFSANAGAMGAKKPYLIIERPQTLVDDNFKYYQGLGANNVRAIADMTGYFKMTDVHLDGITGASESEIEEIKTALERGVIK